MRVLRLLTMAESPGSYEICPVCIWEDDLVQLRWPDFTGGANRPSLIGAQANVKKFGACEQRSVAHVRPPRDDEPLDPDWRPIDPERDHFESLDEHEAPWPDDRTVLYWWRHHDAGFWRRGGQDRSAGLFVASGQESVEDLLPGGLPRRCRVVSLAFQRGPAPDGGDRRRCRIRRRTVRRMCAL
ncbi:hypothetical protein Aab01nite_03640 [Paractinoplanes abujensis]|uniref:Cysteine-rich CPCC domain-containing protein n=1 Tax=Paractinoplanes abujensis TaxID=882441 RepID=A0A7W7CR66_9ACTN|nr:CPCC family cysteine-rich protein [Actinoplanes abujensis]MBB4691805.1 hypothetical protein [Actinoplanes abujensis]GID16774.1 hypothetical protein Aab01nite_03640 [Actinoplanes abujensis]